MSELLYYIFMTDAHPGSPEQSDFYPTEENLGRNCKYWAVLGAIGCDYPKAELQGRLSCDGIIDDVCLFVKDGRKPSSLTDEQLIEIKTRVPGIDQRFTLPPGETV
jgi:hypothetical protein